MGPTSLQGANLGEADLQGANLQGANLQGADLRRADLRGAYLERTDLQEADLRDADLQEACGQRVNLNRANLEWATLRGADLQGADLRESNLVRADLVLGLMSSGESFEEFVDNVVPALLTAGGKTLEEIVASGAWDSHDWPNNPISAAFDCDSLAGVPLLLRSRANQFLHLFTNGLIPPPVSKPKRRTTPKEAGRR